VTAVSLALGPLRYALEGIAAEALPAVLRGYVVPAAEGDRRVTVTVAEVLAPADPDAGRFGNGYWHAAGETCDRVWVRPESARWPGRGLLAALSELVVRDAPSVDAVALHAAALRGGRGLVLVVAPPGTGKTTLTRAAGPDGFAHNAVLLRDDGARALPFAGDPDAALDDVGLVPVRALVELVRDGDADVAGAAFEWAPRARATTLGMKACARPQGRDPLAAQRAVIALRLLAPLPCARLRVCDPAAAWPVLQAALRAWESTS
jgi:hypothetical protein